MNVILLWVLFFGWGGGGREQTPCIDCCNQMGVVLEPYWSENGC